MDHPVLRRGGAGRAGAGCASSVTARVRDSAPPARCRGVAQGRTGGAVGAAARDLAEEGIDGESAAICRGIRPVSRSRLLRPVGQVWSETMRDVERTVAMILGIDRQRLA